MKWRGKERRKRKKDEKEKREKRGEKGRKMKRKEERREKRGEKGRKMTGKEEKREEKKEERWKGKKREEKREKNPDKNNIYRLSDIICPLDAKTLLRDGIVDWLLGEFGFFIFNVPIFVESFLGASILLFSYLLW